MDEKETREVSVRAALTLAVEFISGKFCREETP